MLNSRREITGFRPVPGFGTVLADAVARWPARTDAGRCLPRPASGPRNRFQLRWDVASGQHNEERTFVSRVAIATNAAAKPVWLISHREEAVVW